MKINVSKGYGESWEKDLSSHIEDCLDGSDYDYTGQIEILEETNNKLRKAMGILVEILTDKKLITLEQAREISQSYYVIEEFKTVDDLFKKERKIS